MAPREIQCINCGFEGELGAANYIFHSRNERKIFRHVGHNPYSGHLHYQCPNCKMVLLVPPMDILEEKSLIGTPKHPESAFPYAGTLSRIFSSIVNYLK